MYFNPFLKIQLKLVAIQFQAELPTPKHVKNVSINYSFLLSTPNQKKDAILVQISSNCPITKGYKEGTIFYNAGSKSVLAAFIPATNGPAPDETTLPNFFELLILVNIAGLTLIFNGLVFCT